MEYIPTASGGSVRSGKEVSFEYDNLGKSFDYILTASGRARSGKKVSCPFENKGKSLDYVPVPTASAG